MDFKATRLTYRQTGTFSKTLLDYVERSNRLANFMSHPPSMEGLMASVKSRMHFSTDRKSLVDSLNYQYEGIETSVKTKANISLLSDDNSFTITTAHQPNIFTGPLYFIYKILHVIKLAEEASSQFPQYNFIPVYYMGSEDADLDELGHFYIQGDKYVWNTKQSGAVGRMKVDKELLRILQEAEGRISVLPFGKDLFSRIKIFFSEGKTIQRATFELVNWLFADYGLIVLIPDEHLLKKQMVRIFKDDLLEQKASSLVQPTAEALESAGYKVQANPREINLFYLDEGKRERIEKVNDHWQTTDGSRKFNSGEILAELDKYPEKFSPNVILRGIFQETILPNILFAGGGGEIAYWLQLKELFNFYAVPFPVLLIRNSFLLVEKKWEEKINKLGFAIEDVFDKEEELINKYVRSTSNHETQLNGSLNQLEELYESFRKQAAAIDASLEGHVKALKLKTVQRLHELEKKMLKAEKRKFVEQQRQVAAFKKHLFPCNSLQERIENFMFYYAKWGNDFIHQLYKYSPGFDQQFTILLEQ